MKAHKLYRLVRQNLHRNRRNLVFSSVGIVVGICSFVFFLALGLGIRQTVASEIFPVEANRIQVVPRAAQFGTLAPGRRLDDQGLEQLRAIPGVRAVYPRQELAFLATASLDGRQISPAALELLSRVPGISRRAIDAVRSVRMWLEIIGEGIDPRLVAGDASAGEFHDVPDGEPIPVLLSQRMVEIYNASFAPARGLPRISNSLLPFLPSIPLALNHSYISRGGGGQVLRTRMKIVGLSHHAIMGGITMPLATARRLNRRFAGEQAASRYRAAVVEVDSSDRLAPVQEAVRALGYDIDLGEKRMAQSVGLLITLVTLGFTLISLIIVGLSAVSISHTFFMIIFERQKEIGLLRAVGATRSDIRALILSEAVAVGSAGGLLGIGLGLLLCRGVDWLAVEVMPDFPFKPETFFAYPAWLFAGAIGFAVLFCALGAIFPAQRAASLDPARALTSR